jgi:hypothetical protein
MSGWSVVFKVCKDELLGKVEQRKSLILKMFHLS